MGAKIRLIAGLAALAALAGCTGMRGAKQPDPFSVSTIEAQLHQHVDVLASDAFGGRKPGTEGERQTLRYLAENWQASGLVSATNDPAHPWFAPVELDLRIPASSTARFRRNQKDVSVPETGIRMFTSGRRALVEDAPMVFVGALGGSLEASELSGRIAVMPWGSNGRSAQREALFENGAAAVLSIVDSQDQFDEELRHRAIGGFRLAGENDGAALDGLMTRSAASALLGEDRLDALLERATQVDFHPVPLNLTATLEAVSTAGTVRTHNLIAKLPGSQPGSGAVVLMAHWDHFGTCGTAGDADMICNGAVDNASGLAVMSELAALLAKGPKLDRDVYFVATTAEEWGLLGARAFTRDPPLPLDTIVAAFNIDSIGVAPQGGPVAIVGEKLTPLDDEVEHVIAAIGRDIDGRDFAAGFVRRQDGWAMLQADIPTLMVSSAFGQPRTMRRYMNERYHRSNDNPDVIELGGAAEDVLLHLALVRHFASTATHPGQ